MIPRRVAQSKVCRFCYNDAGEQNPKHCDGTLDIPKKQCASHYFNSGSTKTTLNGVVGPHFVVMQIPNIGYFIKQKVPILTSIWQRKIEKDEDAMSEDKKELDILKSIQRIPNSEKITPSFLKWVTIDSKNCKQIHEDTKRAFQLDSNRKKKLSRNADEKRIFSYFEQMFAENARERSVTHFVYQENGGITFHDFMRSRIFEILKKDAKAPQPKYEENRKQLASRISSSSDNLISNLRRIFWGQATSENGLQKMVHFDLSTLNLVMGFTVDPFQEEINVRIIDWGLTMTDGFRTTSAWLVDYVNYECKADEIAQRPYIPFVYYYFLYFMKNWLITNHEELLPNSLARIKANRQCVNMRTKTNEIIFRCLKWHYLHDCKTGKDLNATVLNWEQSAAGQQWQVFTEKLKKTVDGLMQKHTISLSPDEIKCFFDLVVYQEAFYSGGKLGEKANETFETVFQEFCQTVYSVKTIFECDQRFTEYSICAAMLQFLSKLRMKTEAQMWKNKIMDQFAKFIEKAPADTKITEKKEDLWDIQVSNITMKGGQGFAISHHVKRGQNTTPVIIHPTKCIKLSNKIEEDGHLYHMVVWKNDGIEMRAGIGSESATKFTNMFASAYGQETIGPIKQSSQEGLTFTEYKIPDH